MKPKVKDHYRAHRLSFWLNLIPQLHRPGSVSVIPQHHLLDDHNNPLTYDGVVRPMPNGSDLSGLLTDPYHVASHGNSSTLQPSSAKNSTSTPTFSSTVPPQKALRNVTGATANVTLENKNDTKTLLLQHNAYSTALSITVAVGVSLLILNILIFAGVYYQRDKNRIEKQLQMRNFKVCILQLKISTLLPISTPHSHKYAGFIRMSLLQTL